MIRLALLAVLVLAPVGRAFAQIERVDARSSAAWIEMLGNGGLYSLNAETYIAESVVVRAGFASWNTQDLFYYGANDRYITAPLTTSYVRGSGDSKLETGLGLMFGRSSTNSDGGATFVNATAIFGYRYEPADRRVIYRIVATPFLPLQGDYPHDSFLISIGMSAGFQF